MRPARFAVGRRDEVMHPSSIRAAVSELFATALYVFAAEGSTLALGKLYGITSNTGGLLIVALAHAFAYCAALAVSAGISSGYANPAITFGTLLGGRISLIRALFFWSAQLLGSISASLVLRVTTGGMRPRGLSLALGLNEWNALILEAVTTFGLVYTVYATCIDPRRGHIAAIGPLAAGCFVGASTLACGPFDGAAMNPARVFGPALVGWHWCSHWVYWVGPFLGAGIAGMIYEFLLIPADMAQNPAATQPLGF